MKEHRSEFPPETGLTASGARGWGGDTAGVNKRTFQKCSLKLLRPLSLPRRWKEPSGVIPRGPRIASEWWLMCLSLSPLLEGRWLLFYSASLVAVSYFLWIHTLVTWHVPSRSVTSDSRDPMNYSLPGSSVHGILQARILEWAAISSPRGSSPPRDRTHVSCISRQILYPCTTREALIACVK